MANATAVARVAGFPWRRSSTARERHASKTRWRVNAADEGRASQNSDESGNRNPVVCILWDLDNVSPGIDPERARITAKRLRDAASRLGGGALGGSSGDDGEDIAGPADVVAFLGFGNQATLDRISARALLDEGVDVRRAEIAPDAADMDLGAHVIGFAHAWATCATGNAVPDPPAFVTPRALETAGEALEKDAGAFCVHRREGNIKKNADAAGLDDALDDDALNDDDDDARERMLRNAENASRVASAFFSETAFASFHSSPPQQKPRVPPAAALLIVTSDTDLLPALRYARGARGCFAVVCGDFVPKGKAQGGGGQASKQSRSAKRRFSSKGTFENVGVTRQYWSSVQRAAIARPVGRLRLVAESDAALVWDSTRLFPVETLEIDDEAEAPLKTAPGGVVGVWRRNEARGVGRWPSPRPAIPRAR
jgi:hypothetical protein